MTEVWVPIIGFEDRYLISNLGSVRRTKPWAGSVVMKSCEAGDGYRGMKLRRPGQRWQTYVHILVALHFVDGRTDDRDEVNHKDGYKTNNAWTNLEWVTRSENNKHKNRVLLSHHNRRDRVLTTPAGDVIRTSNVSALCEELGISASSINAVAHGRRSHHKGYTLQ